MNATRLHHYSDQESAPPPDFEPLALKVLSEISSMMNSTVDDEGVLDLFCNAMTRDASANRYQIVSHLHDRGLTNVDIIDGVIPAAARQIGEKWVNDELTFAEVTCSAARMQELSRFLAANDANSIAEGQPGPKVLLIVPREEQHTIGAFVAADQFRRQGLTTKVALGQTAEDLRQTISSQQFSIFGVSAASRGLISPIKTIVDILKEFDETIPVVLGGNILRIDADAQMKTNVDLATSNPSDVAKLCEMPGPSEDLVGCQ